MNVVLGVSGSVAAYRAADLARELMRSGFTVRVCLTDAAQNFVTPALFEALTGQPCLTDTFEEPVPGRMAHIDWARQADLIVVSPATANTLNKIANGVGDDMLTTILLATTKPVVVAPAMNPQMYANEATQTSLQTLRERGVEVVEPVEGDVACGENGQGKLASIPEIVRAVVETAQHGTALKGQQILITSGPTQEPIDDVRYITNRSSGKMGAALAKAALRMGAEVTVIAGPQREPLPAGATVIRVKTAEEMLAAAKSHLGNKTIVIAAAAVADYRLAQPISGKMRRTSESINLELVPNPDIVATLAKAAGAGVKIIGFAAEPTSDLAVAKAKIERKGLHAIAANDVSQAGIGFDAIQNELVWLDAKGNTERSGVMSKYQCAVWLLTKIGQDL
jgi:phosphopantothenoylcysteine decarboxylase / phosphopantothenate---cysteine ligase